MISTFRDYELQDKNHFHAHIEVNPTGLLDVDIIEKNEHHQTELCDISFEKLDGKTRIKGKEAQHQWQMDLDDRDATELHHLISEANEEYEILMRDL
ncbi:MULTISPECIES: hypothetical protein [Vibrio]|uniref:Uncharacterized protein n=1 Tax=Vibrio coralliilyticus TaxID=190893 RepID=A0AAN0W0I8_9VIBR|nr:MULTISPECIES: hypothetical protein [Vibrio]AIS57936.1 hypothetical protein JV59_23500 [Vibrio coralliilyticus]AIW22103.1 hypothetical protein IX92_24365 [Vibrio coralliilyticus]EEX32791.1 hypothetical protein VIC_002241 [Vibrio coralliilyticus ATCC BAA-450]KFI13146.1 hypothetical protein IX95_04145 [Vibrio sp. B183]MCM5507702.1 hypothetical protein [Vibrio sp. SCSIO 43169]